MAIVGALYGLDVSNFTKEDIVLEGVFDQVETIKLTLKHDSGVLNNEAVKETEKGILLVPILDNNKRYTLTISRRNGEDWREVRDYSEFEYVFVDQYSLKCNLHRDSRTTQRMEKKNIVWRPLCNAVYL